MSEQTPNKQALALDLIIKSLHDSLEKRDLISLEAMFRHGASITRRLQEGAEGPLHPEWTQKKK